MERLKSSTGIESLLGDTLENAWRLDRVAHQTILWYDTNHKRPVKRRKHKKFRNPVIQAREIALAMELEGLSRADLARRFGCSRARVTQKLNLLNLPRDLLMEIEALGDRRLVTERGLRRSLRGAPSARYS
jgi:AraC-like DNA-binding protein